MQNLYYLLRKFSFIFLFIFFEAVSLLLIYRNDNFHKVAITNSTNDFTGKIYQSYTNAKEYFYLRRENNYLAKENARLRSELLISKKKFYSGFHTGDTLLGQSFNYIPCKVVKNSVFNPSNYFTIDAGSNYGIKKDMGILSPNGIAGVVINVSSNFALCMSILNTSINSKVRVPVQLKNTSEFGFLDWDGKSPKYALVNNIPSYLTLQVGDTLETSGFSSIFPEGLPVGTVYSYSINPDDGNYVIKILLATNFQGLRNVYAIENLYYNEVKTLNDSIPVE